MADHSFRLIKVYQSLSDNQRNNFWLATSNIFLVVFTFWLGLTVQYIIVDNNAKLNAKLIKLEYYKNISQDYEKLIQQQSLFANSSIAIPKESEPIAILSKYFNLYNSNFQEITNITDSAIVLANKLGWIISERKVAKELETNILKATLFNGLLKCNVINSEIQNRNDLIDAYFKSDFFINQTHIVTTTDFRNEAINLINEIVKKNDSNELFCAKILSEIVSSVTGIFTILNTEIDNTPKSSFEKISVYWDDIPTIVKSLVILILLLIIGFFVANRLLLKMYLPTKNKIYTKEEYNCVNLKKDELEKKIKLLEDSLLQNDAIIYTQQKQIKKMENSIEDKDERYIELLAELGEKNRQIKELEKYKIDESNKE